MPCRRCARALCRHRARAPWRRRRSKTPMPSPHNHRAVTVPSKRYRRAKKRHGAARRHHAADALLPDRRGAAASPRPCSHGRCLYTLTVPLSPHRRGYAVEPPLLPPYRHSTNAPPRHCRRIVYAQSPCHHQLRYRAPKTPCRRMPPSPAIALPPDRRDTAASPQLWRHTTAAPLPCRHGRRLNATTPPLWRRCQTAAAAVKLLLYSTATAPTRHHHAVAVQPPCHRHAIILSDGARSHGVNAPENASTSAHPRCSRSCSPTDNQCCRGVPRRPARFCKMWSPRSPRVFTATKSTA